MGYWSQGEKVNNGKFLVEELNDILTVRMSFCAVVRGVLIPIVVVLLFVGGVTPQDLIFRLVFAA